MTMKLKEQGWIGWFWQATYSSYDLPENLCYFCQSLLTAIVIIPFTWAWLAIKFAFDRKDAGSAGPPFWFTVPVHVVWYAMSVGLKTRIFGFGELGMEWGQYILVLLGLPVALAIFIGVAIGIYYLIKWIKSLIPKRKEPEEKPEKKPNLVFAYLKAKKDKICPAIEWE